MQNYTKDPHARLDYCIDWSDWLAEGETITTHTVVVQTGLTKISDSESDGIVTIWISEGTLSNVYTIAVKIQTNAARIDERTISITIANR